MKQVRNGARPVATLGSEPPMGFLIQKRPSSRPSLDDFMKMFDEEDARRAGRQRRINNPSQERQALIWREKVQDDPGEFLACLKNIKIF